MFLKYADENYCEDLYMVNECNVVKRLLRYILNSDKNMGRYAGCTGVLNYDIETIANQFYITQLLYNYKEIERLIHLIISFPENVELSYGQISAAGQAVADVIGKTHQVVYSVHTDNGNPHIHFVINTVNFDGGSIYKPNTTKLTNYYNVIRGMYPDCVLGRCQYDIPGRFCS